MNDFHEPGPEAQEPGELFLPLQDGSFPDRDHAGRISYNNARLSAMGVPQIAAVLGTRVAGGAYLPALCDELLMVEGSGGIFLAAPHLVKAAIGQVQDMEEPGGAYTHTRLSGMADYEDVDEAGCLARVRRLAVAWPEPPATRYRVQAAREPESDPEALLSVVRAERTRAYDARLLLRSIIDAGSWEEYKARCGGSLPTGTARLNGRAVGIVANQRATSRTAQGEVHVGGVIYGDAAAKAARFVVNCNQKGLPLLFFQYVTGFMVGKRAEPGGIIRDGAKLVDAVANSRVPKLTVVRRKQLWRGELRSLRPGLRPAFPSRLADRLDRRDGRGSRGRNHARHRRVQGPWNVDRRRRGRDPGPCAQAVRTDTVSLPRGRESLGGCPHRSAPHPGNARSPPRGSMPPRSGGGIQVGGVPGVNDTRAAVKNSDGTADSGGT